MKYSEYQQLFDSILENANPDYPYHDESYRNYTKLNRSRMKRWDRLEALDKDVSEKLKRIDTPQHWIIITEPWCGDAAHVIPFLVKMVSQNSLLSYDIQLRDSEPFLIDSYLTNGAKSIPKLIARDENGADIFTWGPRPREAQELVDQLKAANAGFEEIKVALQHWYNEDKGLSLSHEIAELISTNVTKQSALVKMLSQE